MYYFGYLNDTSFRSLIHFSTVKLRSIKFGWWSWFRILAKSLSSWYRYYELTGISVKSRVAQSTAWSFLIMCTSRLHYLDSPPVTARVTWSLLAKVWTTSLLTRFASLIIKRGVPNPKNWSSTRALFSLRIQIVVRFSFFSIFLVLDIFIFFA